MCERRSEEFLRPYREALAECGPGFGATLWGSPQTQRLRFDVMIDRADMRGCAIVDVGCGFGDFAARLVERAVPFTRYHGLDALRAMIEGARARGLARCTFEEADVLGEPEAIARAAPDWACLSGTLNTMEEEQARRIVRSAFDAARRGVVFNFLSTRSHARWSERDPAPARRFDPLRWIDWALCLSSRVTFTQDYLDGHDATIVIHRERAADGCGGEVP
jgi:SAM-dependent methyltransferase